MKLWLFACLLAGFVGAWTSVVHAQERKWRDSKEDELSP